MARSLLAAILLLLTVTVSNAQQDQFLSISPQPASYAWWLRAAFRPFEAEVRGIAVGKLRTTWCKATEFRKDLFPPDLARDFDLNDGLAFAVDGSFDGSKTKQTALVGVYETCAGSRGTFLLVLAWLPNGTPTVKFLREMRSGVQFAMLKAQPSSTISVLHCMECDNKTEFRWNKSKASFVRLRPKDF
jgi:hypothetical protein